MSGRRSAYASVLALFTGAVVLLAGCGRDYAATEAPACPVSESTGGAQSYAEPVILSSRNGVLDVEITAQQGVACLDTVGRPVTNFLTFDYSVRQGTSSNGQLTGTAQYPDPH